MKVTGIETKVLSRSEEDGQITFAIRALVENDSDDADVSVTLQGLDSDGFERCDLYLQGNIPIGTSRSLTTKRDVAADIFSAVATWQVP